MAWDNEQLSNARLIIAIGREMGMRGNEILSGLMAAMQESSLRNIDYGDRDSIGLFQQRPSMGWGTRQQILDPMYATRKYFSTLKGVEARKGMSPTVMAQAVQRSAYPDEYAKWQKNAQELIGQSKAKTPELKYPLSMPSIPIADRGLASTGATGLEVSGVSLEAAGDTVGAAGGIDLGAASGVGTDAFQEGVSTETPGATDMEALRRLLGQNADQLPEATLMGEVKTSGLRQKIIETAKSAIGTPYVWGGESYAEGGFDCSGLIQWAMSRNGLSGVPRVTYQMDLWDQGQSTGRSTKGLLPGDWVFLSPERGANGRSTWGHVAIWLGDGKILEAPRTGLNVRIRTLGKNETYMGYHLNLGGD